MEQSHDNKIQDLIASFKNRNQEYLKSQTEELKNLEISKIRDIYDRIRSVGRP